MSSIMRWRNGLMGLSVMAITPVSHEVSEPHDLETGRAILFIPTSNPPRGRSRWGVYRESGLARISQTTFAHRYLRLRFVFLIFSARVPARVFIQPGAGCLVGI